jgi:hypothetical protein
MPSSGHRHRALCVAAALLGASTGAPAEDRIPDFSYSRPKSPQQFLPPLDEHPAPPRIRFGVFRPFNPIDTFILAKIKENKVRPAPLCIDWDFARRASLDLVGVIPTAVDLERYFNWKTDERRRRWVDFLLKQPQYADHWTIFWGDLLREQGQVRGAADNALKDFLHESLRENRPFDQWVRRLITADGTAEQDAAVAFVLRDRVDPDVLTVTVSQAFLGIQLKCAQCHDHPFDWWTQKDFQNMAAFWQGTHQRRERVEEITVGDQTITRPTLAVHERERRGRGLFLTGATSNEGRGRRALADLVTRRDNPYFARVAVNRLWEKLMGTGLVNPADNFSALNPPSHETLLDWLALEFVDSGYDLRHVLRLIANSRTYQQTTRRNVKRIVLPNDVKRLDADGHEIIEGALFEALPLRRMTAEQIHDSILAACGHYFADGRRFSPSITKTYPPPPRDFLRIFGATDRDTLLPRNTTPSIQQALTLLNGDFVNRAVMLHADHPLVWWQRQQGLGTAQMVDALFAQFLTRLPTAAERRAAMNYVGFGREDWPWEDLQWALINTREFQYIR